MKLFDNTMMTLKCPVITSITCAPCRLNEGFTRFLERKILGRMKGEQLSQMSYLGETKRVLSSLS